MQLRRLFDYLNAVFCFALSQPFSNHPLNECLVIQLHDKAFSNSKRPEKRVGWIVPELAWGHVGW